jgi:ATP adenylyltransferase
MVDHLWNGWRAEYIASAASSPAGDPASGGSESVFTQILQSGLDDVAANIVHRGQRCFVILNAFPYSTGHLLVLPYRQIPELEELDSAETVELWATVTDGVRAVKRAYAPEGVNVGINLGRPGGGSISEHLHVHVVPRWTGDSNFMTTIANTRTLPEALDVTAAKIRAAWPDQ